MLLHITLDIETIGTQREDIRQYIAKTVSHPAVMKKSETIAKWEAEEKPAAVEEAISRSGLDGAFGQVVVVGLVIGDGAPQAISSLSEPYVLLGLNAALDKVPAKDWYSSCIVGHNVSAFDLRFLAQRFIVNKIKPHPIIARAAQAKPWESEKCFDTMVQFAGVGQRISLDKLCMALSIESPKGDMDGSQVGQYVADGRLDEVAAYCLKDVEATREVFRRMTFQTVDVLNMEEIPF